MWNISNLNQQHLGGREDSCGWEDGDEEDEGGDEEGGIAGGGDHEEEEDEGEGAWEEEEDEDEEEVEDCRDNGPGIIEEVIPDNIFMLQARGFNEVTHSETCSTVAKTKPSDVVDCLTTGPQDGDDVTFQEEEQGPPFWHRHQAHGSHAQP